MILLGDDESDAVVVDEVDDVLAYSSVGDDDVNVLDVAYFGEASFAKLT